MAIFIAVVKRDGESAYTASFPDFPGLAVDGPTLDHLLARAREVLALHVERLLEANRDIGVPTKADEIEQHGTLFVAAVDIPDNLKTEHVNLEIPALALARIDAMAGRYGLTRSALFVQAADHWAMQDGIPRDRRSVISDGPTLFDFVSPLELKVEAATKTYPSLQAEPDQSAREAQVAEAEVSMGDIAAELERLIGESSPTKPARATERQSTRDKGE